VNKLTRQFLNTQATHRQTVLALFDEWASKVAVAHAVVQRKAAALARKLKAVLTPEEHLWVEAHSSYWFKSVRQTWELGWSNVSIRARFPRPEDWDYDEVPKFRAKLETRLGGTPVPKKRTPHGKIRVWRLAC
jgi:hypothetical protein